MNTLLKLFNLIGLVNLLRPFYSWPLYAQWRPERLRLIFSVLLMAVPGLGLAQMHGGGMHRGGEGQQHMTGSGMMSNRDMMSNMMGDMDNMMQSQRLTPEQHQQLMQMRNRMGQMMQQGQGSMNPEMEKQQAQQLKEMQQRLNSIKSQTQR